MGMDGFSSGGFGGGGGFSGGGGFDGGGYSGGGSFGGGGDYTVLSFDNGFGGDYSSNTFTSSGVTSLDFSSPSSFTTSTSFNSPISSVYGSGGQGGGQGDMGGMLKSLSSLFGGLSGGGGSPGRGNAMFEAQQKAAAYEMNAQLLDMDAMAFLESAGLEKERELRKSRIRVGQTKSKLLKGGVLLEGSPLLVLDDMALQGALEAEILYHEGEVRATQSRNKATAQRFYAQQALAAGSLLS